MKTKNVIAYGVIGIVIAIIVAYSLLFRTPNSVNNSNFQTTTQLVTNSKAAAIEQYQNQFCGLKSTTNSNDYIQEYRLPGTCEMPLGILVDDNQTGKIWYVSTKQGTFGNYNLVTQKFDKELVIPVWNTRNVPTDNSQVWSVRADKQGGIWFTDEKQNAIWRYDSKSHSFEIYKVPENPKEFGTIYPVSIDFDSKKGNVYFVGIRTPALWVGNITKMKNGTSDGITKIPIPTTGFKGIDPDLISIGSLAYDNKRNVVWISMLSFPNKGEILRYNITSKIFDTFNLPAGLNSPVGIAVDDNGNLWVTDHATSMFFMLNASNGKTTTYATSRASPKIYGVNNIDIVPGGTYTLPYWIEKGNDGALWFNEHEGNKIARFDPSNNTLYEYWIPSQNRLWGNCPPDSKTCGIANVLQFSRGKENGQTWFTEWSENKIGRLNTNYMELPFSVSVSPQQLTLKRGQSAEVKVNISAAKISSSHSSSSSLNPTVEMVASGTFSPGGDLGNSTGTFSQTSFPMPTTNNNNAANEAASFIFTPATDLKPGEYTLMLGAQDNEVGMLKTVKVNIIS